MNEEPPYGTPPPYGAPPSFQGYGAYPGPAVYPGGYYPGAEAMLPPGWVFASYGSRVAAHLLDGVILFAALVPSLALAAVVISMSDSSEDPSPALLLVVFLLVGTGIVFWLYQYVWRTGVRGQSLGKQALGIYVLSADRLQPIGGGLGIARYLVMWLISQVTCGLASILDALWPLWDPRHQALHDKVASSVVVRWIGTPM